MNLRKPSRLTAFLLAGSLLLAACAADEGGEAEDTDEADADSGEADESDDAEGSEDEAGAAERTLVIAAANVPGGFDGDALQPATQETVVQMNEPLLGFAVSEPQEDGARSVISSEIEGRLAESWEISDDGLTATFSLRQGVLSPFGNELTAEDVKWSWDKSFAQERTGNFLAGVANVESVEVVDEYTVQFNLSEPSALLLSNLTVYTPGIYDSTKMKEHATEDDPWALEWLVENHAGFGPYTVESVSPGEQAVFVRNENYYGGFGEPFFDRVIYREVPDASTRQQLLIAGEVDWIEGFSPTDVEQFLDDERVKVQSVTGTRQHRVMMRQDIAPFDDVRVRQAVAYATPYDQINDIVFGGLATVGKSPLTPAYACFTDEHFTYETDLDRARELLAEAGYEDGLDVEFVYSEIDFSEEGVAIQMADALAEVGINVTLRKAPEAQMVTGIEEASLPFFFAGFEALVLDPGFHLEVSASTGGVANDNGYSNPDFDAAVADGNSTFDDDARCAAFDEAQRIHMEDSTWVGGWVTTHNELMAPDIDGFVWNPTNHELWVELSRQ
jgi:peptide/nickel transport system substrate-binding protein